MKTTSKTSSKNLSSQKNAQQASSKKVEKAGSASSSKDIRTLNTSQLVFITITSVLGAGVFNLINEVSIEGSSIPILFIAFLTAFLAFFFLTKILSELAINKPKITGSLTGYSEAFLGKPAGFLSTWGYWVSAWLGNTAILFVFADSIQKLLPIFGTENSALVSFIIASVILWGMLIVNLRGIEVVAALGKIGSIMKIIVILLFVVIAFSMFNSDVFVGNFSSSVTASGSIDFGQGFSVIRNLLLALLFIYIGIEDAPVLAHKAKSKKMVPRAMFISLAVITVIYFLILLAPLSFKTMEQLRGLDYPALQILFEEMAGKLGGVIVAITIILTVPLTYLAWNAEVSHFVSLATKKQLFFKVFGIHNKRNVPSGALLIACICSQFTAFMLLIVKDAYTAAVSTAMVIVLPSFIIPMLYYIVTVVKEKKFNSGLLTTSKPKGKQTKARFYRMKIRKIAMGAFVVLFFLLEFFLIDLTIFLCTVFVYLLGIVLYYKFIRVEEK